MKYVYNNNNNILLKNCGNLAKKACKECYNSNNDYDEEMPNYTEDDYDADDEIPDKNESYNNDVGHNNESLNKAKSG